MPTGLKQTSSLIVIGASISESALNTFTQVRVDLQLNPLDNEVFVVQAIDMETASPDAQVGVNASSNSSLTTTSQTALPSFASPSTLAVNNVIIRAGVVPFETSSLNSPPTALSYLAIISTNDFFLQVQGANNLGAKTMSCKVYGFRARADSAVYAALLASEVMSA